MNERYKAISNSKKINYSFDLFDKSDKNFAGWIFRLCSILVVLEPFYFKDVIYVKNILFVYEILCWVIFVPLITLMYIFLILDFKQASKEKLENLKKAKVSVAKKYLKKKSLISNFFNVVFICSIVVAAATGNFSLCSVLFIIKVLDLFIKGAAKNLLKEET